MAVMDNIHGRFVYLTSIDIDDAEYTLQLRKSDKASKNMPKIDNTIKQQEEWIKYQRSIPNDYFFKICTYDERVIGVVSFYDIDEVNMIAEIGRYIATGTPFENTESLMLIIDTCLQNFNVDKILLHVFKHNKVMYNFWKRLGAKDIKDMDLKGSAATEMILFKQDYNIYRDKICNFLSAT